MSIEYFINEFKEIYGKEPFWIPTLFLILFLSGIFCFRQLLQNVLKLYPKYCKNSLIISFIGIVFTLYNWFIWNHLWVFITSGCIMLLPLLSIPVRYLHMQRSLKKVITLFNSKSIDDYETEALKKLKTLSISKMTSKQVIRYQRYKMYILTKLGNLRLAEKIMEELGPDKLGQAHYYLLRYIVALHAGDIERAHQEIIKACDATNNKTEPIIQVEILANQGVSYVSQKNYHTADDSFNLAIQEYKRLGLNDKTLLDIIYNNYAFNKTRLNKSWEDVASEYKSLLDLECFSDQLNYFNFELQMLRQTNAPREIISEVVKNSFNKLLEGNLPIKNKVLLAGSNVRIVWSAMLDPTQCFTVLNDNYNMMSILHPNARYKINKDLSLLFKDLHGDLPETYSTLRDHARCYMAQQAEHDIQTYRRSLPDEAILFRCYCLEELAGIERNKQDYEAQKVISFLSDAVKLYQDNSLLIDEIKSRLNIMDELCAFENLNENLEPQNPEEMNQQLYEIESLLPKLKSHPFRAEIGIRMSFYCLIIHEYDKCIKYYDWVNEASLSLNHFAPWLHRYRMNTAFAVRILHFKKIIVALRNSQEVLLCTNDVQEWFQSFPNHNGVLDSMLLARFIGWREYPIKTLKWFNPNTPEQFKIHSWFYFTELHLNADITYEQFKEEDNKDQIFFNDDQHPFESNKSKTVAKDISQKGYLSEGINFWIASDFDLSQTEKEIFLKVFELINNHIPSKCPTLIELVTLFKSTMTPLAGI